MTATRHSTFVVPKMDCPSEERLIRIAVEPDPTVSHLRFDLEERQVIVTHEGEPQAVLDLLTPLGMGARLELSSEGEDKGRVNTDPSAERRVLRQLLAINALMFVGELGLGVLAESTGLIADSLDMLADAMVYTLALLAVGRATADQKRSARLSGWLQVLLAIGVMSEVGRRALTGSEPVQALMIGVAVVALAANLACVALLSRHRKGGVHLRASWIFSTNDALANLGVIIAGVLVSVLDSPVPDLVIGAAISVLVLVGAVRILRLR